MEQQRQDNEGIRPVFTLEEPHFDDEATLGAKRVVPLSKIAGTEGGSSKRILSHLFQSPVVVGFMVVLGAAVVGLVLGLAVADYHYRPQSSAGDVSESDRKPFDSRTDSQSQVKIENGHEIPSTSPSTDKVAREVPPKDKPPIVVVKSDPVPVTQSIEDESSHSEKPTPRGNVSTSKRIRQTPINETRERRAGLASVKRRSRNDFPNSDEQERISNQRRYHGREIDRIRDIFMGQEP
jgi:hypothetical protein